MGKNTQRKEKVSSDEPWTKGVEVDFTPSYKRPERLTSRSEL